MILGGILTKGKEKEMGEEIAVKDDVKYLENWATFAANAGLIPQGTTNYQAMAIVQTGKEMGLQPLQALRTMNFIKGRLVMSVQLQLALAKNTKNVIVENMEEGDDYCEVSLQRNIEKITCRYSVLDAKKAGLIKPDGSWAKYQKQMLRWRAIGDALRIICPDLVMGLLSPEEADSLENFSPSAKASGKPATQVPQSTAPETIQVKTNIVSVSKETKKNKSGKDFFVYHLSDKDGNIFSTTKEEFITLSKSAKDAGLEILLTHKNDTYKTIADIQLIEPDLDIDSPKGIAGLQEASDALAGA